MAQNCSPNAVWQACQMVSHPSRHNNCSFRVCACACVCVHCRCVFFPEITRRAKSRSRRIAFSHFHTPLPVVPSHDSFLFISERKLRGQNGGGGAEKLFPEGSLVLVLEERGGVEAKSASATQKCRQNTSLAHTKLRRPGVAFADDDDGARMARTCARPPPTTIDVFVLACVGGGGSFGERDQPTSTASRGGKPAKGKQLRLYWCKTGWNFCAILCFGMWGKKVFQVEPSKCCWNAQI